MKKNQIIFATVGVFFLGLLAIGFAKFHDPQIGKVGDYIITQKDVTYRDSVFHLYTPEDSRNPGLQQLIKAFTYAQILKNNSHPVTDEILQKEEQRIDQKTLLPEKLQSIKAVFKGDQKAYRKIFILPTYVERTIFYDFFLNNPTAQAESKKIASDFLETALKNPSQFAGLAKKGGLKTQKLFISEIEGIYFELPKEIQDNSTPKQNQAPESVSKQLKNQLQEQKNTEAEKWIKEVVNPLQVGQVFSQVIDRGEYWLVARLYKKPKKPSSPFEMETVVFPKADYNDWLERETAKVKSTF